MSSEQVIIQIGDLHFPEFKGETTAVDQHDRATPGKLEKQLGLPVPTAIKTALVRELTLNPDALIAICGDITSKGNRDAYLEGLQYLHGVLNDSAVVPAIKEDRIHLVPGNHDVAYKGDAPFVDFEDVSRFESLSAIASAAGFDDILTITSRKTRVTNMSGGALSVLSVNTCRGAGATRKAANDHGLAGGYVGGDGADSTDQSEVLDVPIFHPYELAAVADAWSNEDPRTLSVLLSHHGPLPQHTPRLNPYTEMVNGGQVRKALANLHRPILYLHGHVHEHVVEVVSTPPLQGVISNRERVIVIAVPQLKDGFNRIRVEFDDTKHAVGLHVETFRLRPGEQTVHREPGSVQIALTEGTASAKLRRFVLSLLAERGFADGAEMITAGAAESPPFSAKEVRSAVESLTWSGIARRTSNNETSFEEAGFHL